MITKKIIILDYFKFPSSQSSDVLQVCEVIVISLKGIPVSFVYRRRLFEYHTARNFCGYKIMRFMAILLISLNVRFLIMRFQIDQH